MSELSEWVDEYKIEHPKKRAFLVAVSQLGNIVQAVAAAEISRGCHYAWMRSDPEYARAFENAMLLSCDVLETEAHRRAVEGVEEPVFHLGKAVSSVRRYSDTLLIFLLKNRNKRVFGDKVAVEQNHSGSVTVKVELVGVTSWTVADAEPVAGVNRN